MYSATPCKWVGGVSSAMRYKQGGGVSSATRYKQGGGVSSATGPKKKYFFLQLFFFTLWGKHV